MFHYSNLAFSLLGEVIAQRSGIPYERYITERIIEPRLGKYREDHAGETLPPHEGGQLSANETLGLRYAGAGLLAVIAVYRIGGPSEFLYWQF